jgi:group I intron endonuclease
MPSFRTEMKGLIYCVHCIPTGKKYIGQTIQALEKRIKRHFCDSEKTDYHFHRAIKKYGKENFIFGVIEECNLEELNSREIYWIDTYNTFVNGYNSDTGGLNGRLLSEDTKDKIRNSLKNRTFASEHLEKIKKSLIGKTLSEETKNKISQSKIGKSRGPLSEEHKKKIGDANRGKKLGPLSEEHKRKVSEALKGKKYKKRNK